MDEDDDGSKAIKPNDIFKRENLNIPFYVDVSQLPFNSRFDVPKYAKHL